MRTALFLKALEWLLSQVDEQTAKEAIDDIIDIFENKYPVLVPGTKLMRKVVSIPDDIGGDED